MIKSTLLISILCFVFSAAAQVAKSDSTKPTLAPRAEPKATKKDAKAQCRDEGRTGKALIDCIKEKSGS